jgi:Protein of unknown function DUF262
LIWKYLEYLKSDEKKQFRYDPVDANNNKLPLHQPHAEIFRFIQREAQRISADQAEEEHQLPDVQVLITNLNVTDELWGFPLPESVKNFICVAQSEEKHKEFCQLFRLLVLSRYMNNRMAFTMVTTKSEDDAFDMFEALNTTGEPLTAFETLKPRIIEEETLTNYEQSASRQHVRAIEEYLDKFKKAEEKQTATSELLVPFALAETGLKLQKRLISGCPPPGTPMSSAIAKVGAAAKHSQSASRRAAACPLSASRSHLQNGRRLQG